MDPTFANLLRAKPPYSSLMFTKNQADNTVFWGGRMRSQNSKDDCQAVWIIHGGAFFFGLLLAWHNDWSTDDMVWSFWLSSLIIGYCTISVTILAGAYAITHIEVEKKTQQQIFPILIGIALFLIVFFSFHFCAFHAGHALFLSTFFPLPGISSNVFDDTCLNPPKLLWIAISKIFPLYGLFLFSTLVAESRNIIRPIIVVRKFVREQIQQSPGNLRERETVPPQVTGRCTSVFLRIVVH